MHRRMLRCILLKFYIKPQLVAVYDLLGRGCILLKFYIKPQPHYFTTWTEGSCILLKFYIKPQLSVQQFVHLPVVSY